ncbi:universal stress protein [Pseudomonas sp. NPDC087358]|uniref:universal stress protein n=1 Tax=Pseudomonas sp. NPDC087358 TaxID=3364439 RepID=UPI00384BE87B
MNDSQRLLLIASSKMQRTPAFERGVGLARARGWSLRILAVDYVKVLELLGLFNHQALATLRDSYLQNHRRWLESEAAQERERGLDCTVQVLWSDHIVDEIRNCIAVTQPLMLIKDVHREPVLKRVFSTPLDWHLLQDCQCPVQFVMPGDDALPSKILAAVNLYRAEDVDLRLNDAILRAAMDLGIQTGASVHVLYTYDWSAIYAAATPKLGMLPIDTGFQEALNDAHEESFGLLCDRHGVDARHRHFLTGTPMATINAFARQNRFDLLVIGTLPRHHLTRIMGNTAEGLLGHAACSVLIVKVPVTLGEDSQLAGFV